jgi:peptidoglycan/LPS O-acetylase OafA/YrhL
MDFLAVIGVTAILSTITYRVIEKPMIGFGNRIAIRAMTSVSSDPQPEILTRQRRRP